MLQGTGRIMSAADPNRRGTLVRRAWPRALARSAPDLWLGRLTTGSDRFPVTRMAVSPVHYRPLWAASLDRCSSLPFPPSPSPRSTSPPPPPSRLDTALEEFRIPPSSLSFEDRNTQRDHHDHHGSGSTT